MSSKSESYGSKFVIVGTRAASEAAAAAAAPLVSRNLPKRTPSRLDNARRWAPAAYAQNHAEKNRRRDQTEGPGPAARPVPPVTQETLPPPPPPIDYEQSGDAFYV